MGKKKTKTQQTQTNSYQYMAPPDTADTSAYRNSINQAYDTPDPSIAYNFGAQRNKLMDRYQENPFGADYSPEVRDAAKYSGMNDLDQMQGQAYREDSFNRKNAKVGALGGIAGLTAPQLAQTGGTMSGTTTQSGGMLGQILGAGAGIGQAALM
jgi:hypothetical protein